MVEEAAKIGTVGFNDGGRWPGRAVAEDVVLADVVEGHAVGGAVFEFHVADRFVASVSQSAWDFDERCVCVYERRADSIGKGASNVESGQTSRTQIGPQEA